MSKIKIGLPKGSLQEATFKLFKKAGFSISASERSYFPSVDDPELYASVNVRGSVMDGVPRFVRSYEDTHGRQT